MASLRVLSCLTLWCVRVLSYLTHLCVRGLSYLTHWGSEGLSYLTHGLCWLTFECVKVNSALPDTWVRYLPPALRLGRLSLMMVVMRLYFIYTLVVLFYCLFFLYLFWYWLLDLCCSTQPKITPSFRCHNIGLCLYLFFLVYMVFLV